MGRSSRHDDVSIEFHRKYGHELRQMAFLPAILELYLRFDF